MHDVAIAFRDAVWDFRRRCTALGKTVIIVVNGYAINILSKSIMNQLDISIKELSSNKLVMHGFNQGAQQAICTVCLEIAIGDLQTSAIFHVMDSSTTYKMLLGCPWIHENRVVTSTLHQCFKFYKQRIRKVDADTKSFSESELHFVDAKFYTKDDNVSEVLSSEVPIAKDTYKLEQIKITTKKSNEEDALNGQKNDESTTRTKSEVPKSEKMTISQEKATKSPVLRNVPLS